MKRLIIAIAILFATPVQAQVFAPMVVPIVVPAYAAPVPFGYGYGSVIPQILYVPRYSTATPGHYIAASGPNTHATRVMDSMAATGFAPMAMQ